VKAMAKMLVICSLILVSGYVAYRSIFPTASIRYRLTLDVDVDGATHTGSGVVDISYSFAPDVTAGLEGGVFPRRYAWLCDHR
jgi:hypothetical protein